MGCGCGKSKNVNKKSSRVSIPFPKKTEYPQQEGITHEQRRTAVAKLKNNRILKEKIRKNENTK
tara:strand:+ start:1799 stop:1990 length:192 start_codon:yes stop_codon:yes gene_type:complete